MKPLRPEEKQFFYYALGAATSSWQMVESNLGRIFVYMLHGFGDQTISYAVYNCVIGLETRIAMVDAAVTAVGLGDELRSEWKSLCNQVNRKRKIRNRLAHFHVVGMQDNKGNEKLALCPDFLNAREFLDSIHGKGYRYELNDLIQFQRDFNKLSLDLMHFSTKAGTFREQQLALMRQVHGQN
jgi:hypothetical protein